MVHVLRFKVQHKTQVLQLDYFVVFSNLLELPLLVQKCRLQPIDVKIHCLAFYRSNLWFELMYLVPKLFKFCIWLFSTWVSLELEVDDLGVLLFLHFLKCHHFVGNGLYHLGEVLDWVAELHFETFEQILTPLMHFQRWLFDLSRHVTVKCRRGGDRPVLVV